MSEIKNQFKKGVFWTALNNYSGQIIGIIISMVLARLLTPYDFGIVATASVLLGFLNLFSNIGVGPAIIQRKDLTQEDLNNIFSITVILGIVLGLLSFVSSWVIADIYDNPILCPVVQVLSLGLFFGALNMVPGALMSKNMRFKETATRGILFQVLFGIVGIIAAFNGAGVYALICPQLFSSFCTFLYNNHFYPVKFNLKFSLKPIHKIFSFSIYIFLFEFVNYFSRNLDKLIIGKFMSPIELGYYEKSYRLMQMPLNNVTSVIYPVLQPIMSNLQENLQEMAHKFNKIVYILATVSFPIAVILFFNAEEIIKVMFGNQWDPAIPPFKILALSIPTTLILNPVGPIYLAANASKRMFWVGVTNTSMDIMGFTIAAIYGGTIEAIAWGWTVPCFLSFINSYYNLYCRVLHSSISEVFLLLRKPTISALLLICFYFTIDIFVIDLSLIIRFVIKMGLGLILLLFYFKISKTFDIISYVKLQIKKNV